MTSRRRSAFYFESVRFEWGRRFSARDLLFLTEVDRDDLNASLGIRENFSQYDNHIRQLVSAHSSERFINAHTCPNGGNEVAYDETRKAAFMIKDKGENEIKQDLTIRRQCDQQES